MHKNKKLHNLLLGISVLPALILMPAMAEDSSSTVQTYEREIGQALSAYFVIGKDGKLAQAEDVKEGDFGYMNEDGTIVISAKNNDDTMYGVFHNTETKLVDSKLWAASLTDSYFENNTAAHGGAMSLWHRGTEGEKLENKVSNSKFIKNHATIGGGAIALHANDAFVANADTVFTNLTFTENSSDVAGGAVLDETHNLDIDASVFNGNTAATDGGAIAVTEKGTANRTINITNSEFENNAATTGGAISNARTDATVNVADSKFTGNTASVQGGAIFNHGTVNVSDNVSFVGNSAGQGGAIANYYATMTIGDNALFQGNSSTGAEEVTGNVNPDVVIAGGAISNVYSDLTIGDNAQFIGNTSDRYAAAILSQKANLKIGNNVVFKENQSGLKGEDSGGALTIDSDAAGTYETIIGDNATFTGNKTSKSGGAIYVYAAVEDAVESLSVGKNATFTGNSAGRHGGAINLYGVSDELISVSLENATFTGNKAKGQGGAIYSNAGSKVTLSGTNTFTGNSAEAGSDIFNDGKLIVANGTTTIDGGIAGSGALTIANGATLNIGNATVEQGSIELNGTMIANLTDHGDRAIVTTDTFTGAGNLSLIAKKSGRYNVFGKDMFKNTGLSASSVVYTTDWDDGAVILGLKSVEDIASETALSTAASQTVVNLVASSSDALNELGVLIQEHLTSGNVAAVEKAHKAINPEEAPALQSVATHVQGTVAKLAANRMSAPNVGRNGGDVNMTAGGVWAQGLYNKSKLNGEFNAYTRGVAAGIDGTMNNSITIGAGYTFNHSDLSLSSRDTEIDSNTMFVYGQYKPTAWYANAILNYTLSDYTEKASALGVAVNSDYKLKSFGGQVMTGYDFANGVTPELGIRYMHVGGDTYTTSLGVKNKISDTDYLTAILGGKYATSFAAGKDLTLRPEVRLAAKYDMLSDDVTNTVALPGIAAYSVSGKALNRFGGEAGIGITMSYKEVDLSLSYDIEVRKDFTSQTGMLKARYNF